MCVFNIPKVENALCSIHKQQNSFCRGIFEMPLLRLLENLKKFRELENVFGHIFCFLQISLYQALELDIKLLVFRSKYLLS